MRDYKPFIFWGVAIVLVFGGLYLLRSILLPFVAAAILAYFLSPVVTWMVRHRLSRDLSVGIVMAVMIGVFAAIVFVVYPLLASQIEAFAELMPGLMERLKVFAGPLLVEAERYLASMGVAELVSQHGSTAAGVVALGLRSLREFVLSTVNAMSLLMLIFLTPVVTAYMLNAWDSILEGIDGLIPHRHRDTVRRLVTEIDTVLSHYIRGTMVISLMLATLYCAAFSAVGLHLGVLIGFMLGMIAWIPTFGVAAGCLITLTMSLFQWPIGAWEPWFLVGLVFVSQQFSDIVLVPRLVGKHVGLHALWIILGMLAGGVIYGTVGLLISLPAGAVIGVLVRFAVRKYKASSVYYDPAVEAEERIDHLEAIPEPEINRYRAVVDRRLRQFKGPGHSEQRDMLTVLKWFLDDVASRRASADPD